MQMNGNRRLAVFLLTVLVTACSGCADYEWAVINPWIRRQWAEDEKFGPTAHQQLADLERIQRTSRSLSEQQREAHAQRIAELYREEPSPVLRAEMARTAGKLKAPSSTATLRAALADANSSVRIAACQGWADHGGDLAIDALAGVVGGDTDLDVRLEATRALGEFEQRPAVQALSLALEDADPALQRRAMESLRDVSGRDYGYDVLAWREFVRGGDPQREPPGLAERFGSWFR